MQPYPWNMSLRHARPLPTTHGLMQCNNESMMLYRTGSWKKFYIWKFFQTWFILCWSYWNGFDRSGRGEEAELNEPWIPPSPRFIPTAGVCSCWPLFLVLPGRFLSSPAFTPRLLPSSNAWHAPPHQIFRFQWCKPCCVVLLLDLTEYP
jgi:hypothetical protein